MVRLAADVDDRAGGMRREPATPPICGP